MQHESSFVLAVQQCSGCTQQLAGIKLLLGLHGRHSCCQCTGPFKILSEYFGRLWDRYEWFCRLQDCVGGADCDAEVDDQLQHLVSVHIRSRYSTEYPIGENETDFQHSGPELHRPASYMHYALHKWYVKFRKARGLSMR